MHNMRADAARNFDVVLQTGAAVLAEDPSASMAAIAERAGVDRSTVYRRFANREALLAAVYKAKNEAAQEAMDDARLEEAPVAVALHRYVENIVGVTRRWPVDTERFMADPVAGAEAAHRLQRLRDFVSRATREGLFNADEAWTLELLRTLPGLAAHRTELEPGPAADLVVRTLLEGAGQNASTTTSTATSSENSVKSSGIARGGP
jgi:AcrR family transcriptional regulator